MTRIYLYKTNLSLYMIPSWQRKGDGLCEKKDLWLQSQHHSKTIVLGVLSLDGKQLLFRQYDRFDSQSFIAYLEDVRKKFKKFVIFVDRATQHRSKIVKEYLQRNLDAVNIEYFPVR